jgi:prepilin-type N-terminal cleavage/methylation domain-containing protein
MRNDVRRAAFTLIELTVVLLILAIAAGAVALKVAGPLSRVEFDAVADRISQFDALTRRYATEHDRPVGLLVDLSNGRISRIDGDGAQLGGELDLPEGVRIAAVIVAGRRIATGRVSIALRAR